MKQCTSVYNSNTSCNGGAVAVACDDGKPLVKDNLIKIAIDGTVQVSKNGIWGNINAYKWDNADAKVLCKEQGFDTGEMKQSIYSDKPRWMFDVDCQGDENSIFSCPYKDLPDNDTTSLSGNARVFCYNRSDANEYRLENGDHGRLIRNKDNQEGYVCDFIRFYDQEATVVCKTLGFNRGERLESSSLPEGTKWWGVQLSCFYGSSTIESCKVSDWSYSYNASLNSTRSEFDKCRNTSYAISVSCYGQVRLHDDSNNIGIVLVRTGNNERGAFCADGFDLTDGDVACREIGYSGISRIVAASTFSHLNYSIVSYNYDCVGGEMSLLNCSNINQTNCASRNYATIECIPNTTPSPTIRSTYPGSSNNPNYSKVTSISNVSGKSKYLFIYILM
ncbi:scavenger receptor cysteine-rich type 1 protein M130-like [Patella vulgata]|uniref:scavenger receptor cysteine-rich type 1 protein M130-like n=1 Tax=Patella vulgata TaxID=6465 RepID=UPI0024A9B5C1|nr:scavenger receptor cysteine-rich type 1 protein M130-like [Patella vulgata]